MRAVVGSENPVKIAAARRVLRCVYGDLVCIEACRVDSGVSRQPWGDEETLRGARNRAEAALRVGAPTLGIGFEGGLVEVDGRVFTCAWCAVVRKDGAMGMAGGAHLLLPSGVAASVRAGSELGPTMDVLTGLQNTKQDQGAIGILTDGHLDRQLAYEHLLTLALAPLLTPAYYAERDHTSE
ncbi:MAG: inosine/xanthosine triphosphatase [Anaerolineae bacterium]|jgi:inosine/xanthosine triphosphatase